MHTDGFVIGYIVCRFIGLLLYGSALYSYPAVRPTFLYSYLVHTFIFLISFVMGGFRNGRPTFIMASCILEFVLLVLAGPFLNKFCVVKLFGYPEDSDLNLIPLNLSVGQRRLCMWIMMVCSTDFI